LKTLTTCLGPAPKYLGWLALGWGGRGYGFVFAGRSAPVLIAWMPAGLTDRSVSFTGDVERIDPLGTADTRIEAGRALELADAPVLVIGLPPDWVKQARANAVKNFPWGGDHSASKTIRFTAGLPDESNGVVLLDRAGSPTVTFADGSTGILLQGDIDHPVSFYVHPSFASFGTKEYYVRVRVRRVRPGTRA
jgi:polysaccharide biosynthesis protein PslG